MANQIISLAEGAQVFYYLAGRAFRVTCIANSVEDANAYLRLHQTQGVIGTAGDTVFIAETQDKGQPVKLR